MKIVNMNHKFPRNRDYYYYFIIKLVVLAQRSHRASHTIFLINFSLNKPGKFVTKWCLNFCVGHADFQFFMSITKVGLPDRSDNFDHEYNKLNENKVQ